MQLSFVENDRTPRTSPKDIQQNVRLFSETEVWAMFLKPDSQKEYREFLAGDDPEVRLYGDLDLLQDTALTETDVKYWTAEVRSDLDTVVDKLKSILRDPSDISYALATRHGYDESKKKWKMSFRPYFSGLTVKSSIAREVWDKLGKLEWDLAPFGKNRLLGMVNCAKGWKSGRYDDRVLLPECPDDDPLKYVAQAVDEKWPPLLMSTNRKVHPMFIDQSGSGDPDYIAEVLVGIKHSDDYDRWTRVGWAISYELGKTERAREMFREWSSDVSNYDPLACNSIIDNARTEGRCCRIGTLMRFLAADNPQVHQSITAPPDDDSRVQRAVARLLRDKISCLANLPDDTAFVSDGDDIRFESSSGIAGWIRRPSLIVEMQDGTWHGPLTGSDFTLKKTCFHKIAPLIVPSTIDHYQCQLQKGMATITPIGSETDYQIACDDPFSKDPTVRVNSMSGYKPVNKVVGKSGTKSFKQIFIPAYDRHVQQTLGNNHATVVNFGTQNNLVVAAPISEDPNKEFVECRNLMLASANENGYRKANGYVWEPVEDCPLAFVPIMTGPDGDQHLTYSEFINIALRDNETFNSNPRRLTELESYLKGYTKLKLMPEYRPARDILSFSNGALRLSTSEFTPYSEGHWSSDIAARHHIHQPWTGNTETPLFDKILNHQFDKPVADLLCALIGRLFFKVGQLDDWQVCPYIVGSGATGKSVILSVITAMLRPGCVGNLATKREEVFGLANLMDKELVVGRDMPQKLSGVIPQETLQSMVTGEDMEVAIKNKNAVNITWTIPSIMTSNHFPDYVSTGNNSVRRLAVWRFDVPVDTVDYSLKSKIIKTELPNIIARCLHNYHALRNRIENEGISFWEAVPEQMLLWKNMMANATNKIHAFLEMEDDERGCKILKEDGHVTWLLDFKSIMEDTMGAKSFSRDVSVFNNFGFTLSTKREHVCKHCKQIAKAGCCPLYTNASRVKKDVIYGMRLELIESTELG